jgi:hypothetical protein
MRKRDMSARRVSSLPSSKPSMAYLVNITARAERDFLSPYEEIHAGESVVATCDSRSNCEASTLVASLTLCHLRQTQFKSLNPKQTRPNAATI